MHLHVVKHFRGYSAYLEYHCVAEDRNTGTKYDVYRRYTEFESLVEMIKMERPWAIIPVLPEKNMNSRLWAVDSQEV